jgi:putative nucleotidyltransferase with HDIG domain
MKTLHSLTQQFEQWRRGHQPQVRRLPFKRFNFAAVANEPRSQSQPTPVAVESVQPRLGSLHRHHKIRLPLLWVVGVVALTSVTGHRFYNQPKLDVGTEAPETIRAPFDASVEDTKTTEEKRKAARTQFVPVLMFDQTATQQIYRELEQALMQGTKLRSQAGDFPFLPTAILSNSSQAYLRKTEEWEWRAVLATVDSAGEINSPSSKLVNSGLNGSFNPAFAKAVAELQSYRRSNSAQVFTALIQTITQARQSYTNVVEKLSSQSEKPTSLYSASLLDLSDEAWQQMQVGSRQAASRILTQGIPAGLPANILQAAIKMQVNSLVPPVSQPLATKLLLEVLRPNLTEDKAQMQEQAEKAAQAVKPEMVTVRQGEAIVLAGKEITQADFVLLDYFGLSRRGINWLALLGFGGMVTGAVGIFLLVEQRVYPYKTGQTLSLRRRDHLLVLILSLSTPLLGTLGANYTNLPLVGWLVGSFYGPALGVTAVGLLTGLVTSSLQVGWDYLLGGAAAGLLGAMMAGRMRSREELALLGGGVGLTQGVVYLIVRLILSATTGTVASTILLDAGLYALAGLAWSIVALGISPYLEHLFDLVTPIRLVELANPNRPLLKRLGSETPGTFQHTLFVANLAEAAARELGCNVELVRAGTLYHDIGKMHDPKGFIENQMGEANKHDEINDPWQSAQIIKKHVSEGIAMARKHRLPKAIRAFIPEHQGTILIAYFYHQAQQIAQQDPTKVVRDEDFRYDGPIPQSRETGIVMLADACEAALRSLKDTTPENALSMINKILRARWQDNQLVDSGLTREDLSIMAEVFVQVWQQSNHQRIAYPKLALTRLRSAIKSQQSGTAEHSKE